MPFKLVLYFESIIPLVRYSMNFDVPERLHCRVTRITFSFLKDLSSVEVLAMAKLDTLRTYTNITS